MVQRSRAYDDISMVILGDPSSGFLHYEKQRLENILHASNMQDVFECPST
ncbi:hypothetical protein BACI71_40342 [Bacillus mycoides]|uniref:Uncharacterized protein n=1 Tax=Bacillus mycoides TaxID=1405 RepID=A0A653ZZ67_BACMY|nr:hypothetical protein BACI71_40342 [Bacillus mycoides]